MYFTIILFTSTHKVEVDILKEKNCDNCVTLHVMQKPSEVKGHRVKRKKHQSYHLAKNLWCKSVNCEKLTLSVVDTGTEHPNDDWKHETLASPLPVHSNLHIPPTYFECSSQQCVITWKSVGHLSFGNNRNQPESGKQNLLSHAVVLQSW